MGIFIFGQKLTDFWQVSHSATVKNLSDLGNCDKL